MLRQLGFDVVAKERTRAFILTWKSENWTWENYDQHVADTKDGKTVEEPWTTKSKGVVAGDRVFLLRQGKVRGLTGAGRAASDCHLDEREHEWRKTQPWCIQAAFDTVLAEDEVLPTETLIERIPRIDWRHIFASGNSVPTDCLVPLENLWKSHLEWIGRIDFASPDEVGEQGQFTEGAAKRITVNAYERNPDARKACIAHYGTVCVVCGFDFAQKYGEVGEGFTHVHHLRDLATMGEKFEVDPVKDLRPVCPNCHAMLHRTTPAMGIEK